MKRPSIFASPLPGWSRLAANGIRTAVPKTSAIAKVAAVLAGTACLMLFAILGAARAGAQNPIPAAEGWVVLPVEDYRALRRAAFPLTAEPAPPPVEATLSRIDYDLKADGDLASGEARLTVDVIKDGWVRLAIPIGLMVREARLDGRQVSLVTEAADKGPGASYLLLSHPGRSVLTLGIVAPITTVAGTDILQLPVNSSAISRATLSLARQGVDVRVTGGLLLERSESAAGSRWVAHGRGNQSMTFAWRRRVDDVRTSQALRLRGALTELVGLGEDATQINAEVQVEVLQGIAQEVHVQLPAQFTVNQVSGAMVADWDATARELTVSFIEPVQHTARFTISGELRLPRDGKLDIPLLRLPAAERETGGIAVEVLGAGEIKEREPVGLAEAEAAELGQLISSRQSPSLIAFRLQPADGKSQRALSLSIARYTPQAVLTANIEEADYSALVTPDGKMLVQSRFAVRNNQRNFLKLGLPATAVLWSASVAGRPIRPGRAPDGALLLPLEKSRSGDEAPAFVVEVSYMDRAQPWTDKGRARITLLAVDLPISKSRLLVHYSPLFRLTPQVGASGNFRVAPYEAPESGALQAAGKPGVPQPINAEMPVQGAQRGQAAQNSQGAQTLAQEDEKSESAKQLVSRLHDARRAASPARNLPLRVAFPHFGPSVFLVSELTSENQTPVLEFDFQRDKKRGEK